MARNQLAPNITEKQFQAQVMQLARLRGWSRQYHTHNSRRSVPGFPDLVLVRRVGSRCELIFAELKVGKNKATPEQAEWLADLRDAGQRVYLWTPGDWSEIDRELM